MTIRTQTTTLESLVRHRGQLTDRVIARVVLDRHMKRGKLDEAVLANEISAAIAKRNALGFLAQAAGDVLAEQGSGYDAEYADARAFLDVA